MSKKHMTDERLKEISGLIGPFTKPFIVEMFYEIAALREENAKLRKTLTLAKAYSAPVDVAREISRLRDVLESAPDPKETDTWADGEGLLQLSAFADYMDWFHGPRAEALK